MSFFLALGCYGIIVLVAMLFAPRTALVAGAMTTAVRMGWISWPIADMPAVVLVCVLLAAGGGLAVSLDAHYWEARA